MFEVIISEDDKYLTVLALAYTSVRNVKMLDRCQKTAQAFDAEALFLTLRLRIQQCPHCQTQAREQI